MTEHNDGFGAAVMKVMVAWIGWVGGMKLSDWVLAATLVYTVLQIYFLVKNKGKR